MNIQTAVWSTVRASDGEKGGPNMKFGAGGQPLPSQAAQSTWPTPTTRDHKDGSPNPNVPINGLLGRMVWPTPQARDHFPAHTPEYIASKKAMGHGMANLNDVAAHTNGSSAPTEKPGALNPEFVCWLMGFPPEWLSCAPSATPSIRARRPRS